MVGFRACTTAELPLGADRLAAVQRTVSSCQNRTSGLGLDFRFACYDGGPLLPFGLLVECAQHYERHRGDAGLDGRLRHRREQRGMVAGKRWAAIARRSD